MMPDAIPIPAVTVVSTAVLILAILSLVVVVLTRENSSFLVRLSGDLIVVSCVFCIFFSVLHFSSQIDPEYSVWDFDFSHDLRVSVSVFFLVFLIKYMLYMLGFISLRQVFFVVVGFIVSFSLLIHSVNIWVFLEYHMKILFVIPVLVSSYVLFRAVGPAGESENGRGILILFEVFNIVVFLLLLIAGVFLFMS